MKDFYESTTQNCIEDITYKINNSIYTIFKQDKQVENKELGIGFFCYINYETKKIPFIIINSIVQDKEDIETIKIFKNDVVKEFKLGKTRFKNKNFNMTIFQIEENQENEIYFW